MSPIINIYISLIKDGYKKLEDIPKNIYEDVKKGLERNSEK